MQRFLKTAVPVVLGLALWNLTPWMAVKLAMLAVAVAIIAVPILRGRYGHGQEAHNRMASLILTGALLFAATAAPLPDASVNRPASFDVENTVEIEGEVMEVQLACGFACKVAWSLVGGALWDGVKISFEWFVENVWNAEHPHFGTCSNME